MRRLGCLLLFAGFSIPVVLAEEGGDKSSYNLFRPTPDALLTMSVTVGRDIGKWSGYVELFSDVSNESHAGWVANVDCGMSYPLTRDVQLDAGVNIGLTSAADDVNPFVGLSVRY